jgi:hypothetical protein
MKSNSEELNQFIGFATLSFIFFVYLLFNFNKEETLDSTLPSILHHQATDELVPNEDNTKDFLSKHDWPLGLQNLLLQNIVEIPFRFFICDDSGSMSTKDGKRIILGSNGTSYDTCKCTRWAEMTESLKFHANLAHALNMPTEFRFLNNAPPIHIGGHNAHPNSFATLEQVLKKSPGGWGGTPLCRHIRAVTAMIKNAEPSLRRLSQKVSITIITDGESTDGDLAKGKSWH